MINFLLGLTAALALVLLGYCAGPAYAFLVALLQGFPS